MEKVDCHALQGKARNDRKASFLKRHRILKRLQRILRFAMRNRGFQAIGKGVTFWVVMTADNRAESTIYRAKLNPPAKQ